jgi:hypothetical protein
MASGLANPEPSTHGTKLPNRDVRSTVTIRGDMKRTFNSVENDATTDIPGPLK